MLNVSILITSCKNVMKQVNKTFIRQTYLSFSQYLPCIQRRYVIISAIRNSSTYCVVFYPKVVGLSKCSLIYVINVFLLSKGV